MSRLKHPLLINLSKLVEQERTAFKWIDLYAAQFIANSFSNNAIDNNSVLIENKSELKKPVLDSNGMADLFDGLNDETPRINEADIIVLALMCSQQIHQGNTHLNLTQLPQDLMTSAKACGYRPSFYNSHECVDALNDLNQAGILRVIKSSAKPNNYAMPLDDEFIHNQSPLVLFKHKLYLAKYWSLHQAFERWLQSRAGFVERLDKDVITDLSALLKKVFSIPDSQNKQQNEIVVNWQAVSAAHTLLNPFSLITGGPGTGKTTTAASLLFLLMHKRHLAYQNNSQNKEEHRVTEKLHVRLLAPTGKAAVKLADSIRQQLRHIESRILGNDLTELRMSDCLPETGETVHRFLYEMGGLRDSFQRPKRFKGDEVLLKRSEKSASLEAIAQAKKPLDVVIVDESSMMDLALMVELVSLMPSTTQLILLGDHYQLPAVDPGQVFTECVERFSKQNLSGEEIQSLSTLTAYSKDQLTEFERPDFTQSDLGFQPLCSLRKTYRFGGDLKTAAEQIKAGEIHAFKTLFWNLSDQFQQSSSVVWYEFVLNETIDYQAMVHAYADYFNLVAKRASLALLAKQFESYQLLCSTLEGPLGVHFLNTYIEQRFHSACFPKGKAMGELYHGKAILVTRNHPHLGIYNGDIGFVIEDEATANLNVHFPIANHDAIVVPPARIKEWQTAYAMTVHKSQGSEYQNVGVVLADYAKELLSRALLYTALTRSKNRCDIWASDESLHRAFKAAKP